MSIKGGVDAPKESPRPEKRSIRQLNSAGIDIEDSNKGTFVEPESPDFASNDNILKTNLNNK